MTLWKKKTDALAATHLTQSGQLGFGAAAPSRGAPNAWAGGEREHDIVTRAYRGRLENKIQQETKRVCLVEGGPMHSPLSFFIEKVAPPLTLPPPQGTFVFCFLRRRQKGRARIFPVVGRVRKIEGKQNTTENDQQVHHVTRETRKLSCVIN